MSWKNIGTRNRTSSYGIVRIPESSHDVINIGTVLGATGTVIDVKSTLNLEGNDFDKLFVDISNINSHLIRLDGSFALLDKDVSGNDTSNLQRTVTDLSNLVLDLSRSVLSNTSESHTNNVNIANNESDIIDLNITITGLSGSVHNLDASFVSSVSRFNSSIDVNTGNITTNTSGIATNAGNISTNTSNISTNTSNISSNTTDISSNTSNIATNTSGIATNTGNIATNTGNISTNTGNISTNTSAIATNTSAIATNTSGISTHTTAIATNTGNIATNTTDISTLQGTITGHDNSLNSLQIWNKDSSNNISYSDGNVAIGTGTIIHSEGGLVAGTYNDNSGVLFVVGNGTGSGARSDALTLDNSGNLDIKGDLTAFSTSDIRLKTNVTKIKDPLDKLGKINGYMYDWIENGDTPHKGRDVGVIAQEIEEILPELTITRDNGYKAVKYDKIVALLIECIKEQQTQIDALKQG